MAKHGLVAMTRSFLISEPKVYDTEKIKCYALCPTFADTNLVRSWKTKGMKTEYAFIASLMRILTIEDVGDAMMASLKYDKVYASLKKNIFLNNFEICFRMEHYMPFFRIAL